MRAVQAIAEGGADCHRACSDGGRRSVITAATDDTGEGGYHAGGIDFADELVAGIRDIDAVVSADGDSDRSVEQRVHSGSAIAICAGRSGDDPGTGYGGGGDAVLGYGGRDITDEGGLTGDDCHNTGVLIEHLDRVTFGEVHVDACGIDGDAARGTEKGDRIRRGDTGGKCGPDDGVDDAARDLADTAIAAIGDIEAVVRIDGDTAGSAEASGLADTAIA